MDPIVQAQAVVAEVGVPVGALDALSYAVPPSLGPLLVGQAVTVPVGTRRLTGYVLALRAPKEGDPPLKAVLAVESEDPLTVEALLPLYRWAADYYGQCLGEVLRAALPAATREATRLLARLVDPPPAVQDDDLAAPLITHLRGHPQAAARLRADGFGPALDRAIRQGWVSVAQERGRAATRVRTVPRYSLALSPLAARARFSKPGPVRDRLIDWLDRFGPATRAEIDDAFPEAAAPLRALKAQGVVHEERVPVDPDAADRSPTPEGDAHPRPLTGDQDLAWTAVEGGLDRRRFEAVLLRGVTGSGKTEVYLRAARGVLDRGGTALLLVPEIGLTPQFLGRFRARFGERIVGVLHSGLSARERVDEWRRILLGEARIVIGPRSAIWAPLSDLRLIVVDEEHDHSYKQEEGLRYHARDVALVRGQKAGALVLLGSATPSLESVRNAQEGRYRRIDLPTRVLDRPMPEVEVVDLKKHPPADPEGPEASLSPPMRAALIDNHREGGQTILLLNRRGFATTVLCTHCSAHFRCDQCDLSLTYHGRRHKVVCHGCGRAEPLPEQCPACSHPAALKLVGRGTERVEDELLQVLPHLRFDRMDADTTRSRQAHRRILDRFRAGEIDVLIGTQMVAKGHDFPGVTLVGVLHADAALHLPDFRASERTFQLVAQVAGRAGRGERPGRVIVQSHHPDHHAIRLALQHDWEGFVARELPLRRGLFYPPYARLLLLRCSAPQEPAAMRLAALVRTATVAAVRDLPDSRLARVLGPAPAPIFRLQGRFRFQILVKAVDHAVMGRLMGPLRAAAKDAIEQIGGQARVVLDRDPMTMM